MDKIELNIENALSALKPGAFDSLAPVAQDAFIGDLPPEIAALIRREIDSCTEL